MGVIEPKTLQHRSNTRLCKHIKNIQKNSDIAGLMHDYGQPPAVTPRAILEQVTTVSNDMNNHTESPRVSCAWVQPNTLVPNRGDCVNPNLRARIRSSALMLGNFGISLVICEGTSAWAKDERRKKNEGEKEKHKPETNVRRVCASEMEHRKRVPKK
jgi:hypothetical protein